VTDEIVRQCAELGIRRVWMHRSFGEGSVSQTAVDFCRKNQIAVIPGGCPMMFCEPVDFGHKCMRWILSLTGGLPRKI
jgi:predicted CoA-binding protein